MVDNTILQDFISEASSFIRESYGEDASKVESFGRVHESRYKALKSLLSKTKGEIIVGGDMKISDGYFISPTIVHITDENDALFQEELFGPVMIVFGVDNVEQAVKIVQSKPSPLALYIYSGTNEEEKSFIINKTRSGFVGVNGVLQQFKDEGSFLAGVGHSGMGGGYGHDKGFETFSHARLVVDIPSSS